MVMVTVPPNLDYIDVSPAHYLVDADGYPRFFGKSTVIVEVNARGVGMWIRTFIYGASLNLLGVATLGRRLTHAE